MASITEHLLTVCGNPSATQKPLLERDIHIYKTLITPYVTNLKPTIRPVHVSNICFDKQLYMMKYPICWFRSFCFMLFMDSTVRNILLNVFKDIKFDESDTDSEKLVGAFISDMAAYIENGVHVKQLMGQNDEEWYTSPNKSMYYLSMTKGYTLEHAWLLFMSLLNHLDSRLFYVSTIKGGWGDLYAHHFFHWVLPTYTENNQKLHLYKRMSKHDNIVLPLEKNSRDPRNVEMILIHNDMRFYRINPVGEQTLLFVTYNDKVYTLSSMIMTNIIKLGKSMNGAHQFSIYRCNKQFYSESYNKSSHIYSIEERPFIEYILFKQLLPDNVFNSFMYDLQGSIRLTMYTPTLFPVSKEECELLYEFANIVKAKHKPSLIAEIFSCTRHTVDINEGIRMLAILGYFTASIQVDIYPAATRNATKNRVAPLQVPLNLWNIHKWTENKYVFRMNLDPKEHICSAEGDPKQIVDAMYKILLTSQSTILAPGSTLKVKSFFPRNVMQYSLLTNMFKMLNMHDPSSDVPPEGGGIVVKKEYTHIRLLKNQKVYKVRYDKHKKRYINVNKSKVYLANIKGSYRYA